MLLVGLDFDGQASISFSCRDVDNLVVTLVEKPGGKASLGCNGLNFNKVLFFDFSWTLYEITTMSSFDNSVYIRRFDLLVNQEATLLKEI